MSWGRVTDPGEVVRSEQELDVYVLKVDKEREKIALSLKHLTPSPWSTVADKYPDGSRHHGSVSSTLDAFSMIESNS